MRWWLIIKEFGHNIQHKAGVDNIVANNLRRLTYLSVDKYEPITSNYQCQVKKLSIIIRAEKNKGCFQINLLNVQKIKKSLKGKYPNSAHILLIRGRVNPNKLLTQSI